MRSVASILLALAVFAGCNGDDEEPPQNAKQTAQAWVDAINAEDYEEACDLSVFALKTECVEVMKEKPFGEDLEVEGFYFKRGEEEATFAVSSSGDRKPRGEGWTAYAPTEGFRVERNGDAYLVHFEISVIK